MGKNKNKRKKSIDGDSSEGDSEDVDKYDIGDFVQTGKNNLSKLGGDQGMQMLISNRAAGTSKRSGKDGAVTPRGATETTGRPPDQKGPPKKTMSI